MSETGEFLLRTRERRGISKYAVAAASGVSHGNLFRIERGERFPTPDVINRLLRTYDLSEGERALLFRHVSNDLTRAYDAAIYGDAGAR
jgi:transcriptional regulator with XRE-family HTH domain